VANILKVKTKPAGTVKTAWEIWTYNVWSNKEDGFEVNNRFCQDRKYVIYAPAEIYNVGLESEFRAAAPSDTQMRDIFELAGDVDIDGDDLSIYVSKDGYPVGELIYISHESLSPVGKMVEGFYFD